MEVNYVKQLVLDKHLAAMLTIDKELYEKIMDTPGFAYHLNQICLLAKTGDNWYKAGVTVEPPITKKEL